MIQDSCGARFAIISKSSGAPDDFTITDTGNSTGLTFTKPVTGTNASLTVDSIPISSATNGVSGVLQGVTLDLAGSNPSETVTLGVKRITQPRRRRSISSLPLTTKSYRT